VLLNRILKERLIAFLLFVNFEQKGNQMFDPEFYSEAEIQLPNQKRLKLFLALCSFWGLAA
jgi:hypothetical protein